MRRVASIAALSLFALTACSSASSESDDGAVGDESAIVGGKRDTRWSASGYLVHGPSMERLDMSRVACGATLIAPKVIVTAAHCVLADANGTWAFGTGDVGSGKVVKVVERKVHPDFHAEAQGSLDIDHALRKFDVAYLILEKAVEGVTPAALPTAKPPAGCNLQALGYRREGARPVRVSTPACLLFRVQLGSDPIFEMHPEGLSALCVADGDEGSAVVERGSERQVLVGVFVGSVTQGFTDCRRGTQFLNGYESAFGYRAFFQEGIARGGR
jgi:hypothetical protein